jgi:phospholipid-binding lipoprotein MlaA
MRPVSYIEHDMTRWSVRAVAIIDVRADVLEIESSISGDRYIFLRDFYLQSRRLQAGEVIEDDFGSGFDSQGDSGFESDGAADDGW